METPMLLTFAPITTDLPVKKQRQLEIPLGHISTMLEVFCGNTKYFKFKCF